MWNPGFPAWFPSRPRAKERSETSCMRCLVRLFKQVVPSLTAKSSCSQFDQGNVILLVVKKSIAYQQPGGGGTQGKLEWRCAAEAFKPWLCIRQKLPISLPKGTYFYDLDSFRFAYPFQQFQTNIMELDFLEKKFFVQQKSTAHRQPSHSCFQRRKTPFSRF